MLVFVMVIDVAVDSLGRYYAGKAHLKIGLQDVDLKFHIPNLEPVLSRRMPELVHTRGRALGFKSALI